MRDSRDYQEGHDLKDNPVPHYLPLYEIAFGT